MENPESENFDSRFKILNLLVTNKNMVTEDLHALALQIEDHILTMEQSKLNIEYLEKQYQSYLGKVLDGNAMEIKKMLDYERGRQSDLKEKAASLASDFKERKTKLGEIDTEIRKLGEN